MWAELGDYREREDIEVKALDIAGDEELERRFGERVPILAHRKGDEMVEICQFFLDTEEVDTHIFTHISQS